MYALVDETIAFDAAVAVAEVAVAVVVRRGRVVGVAATVVVVWCRGTAAAAQHVAHGTRSPREVNR